MRIPVLYIFIMLMCLACSERRAQYCSIDYDYRLRDEWLPAINPLRDAEELVHVRTSFDGMYRFEITGTIYHSMLGHPEVGCVYK